MKQEHGMHRLADAFVTAEREREIRYAAGHMCVRNIFADPPRGLDESQAVTVMFLDTGRHGEYIRVENNILGRKADLVHQDIVGTLADRGLAFECIGLAFFIKRHHHHGRAIAAYRTWMFNECGLPPLHPNSIYHPPSLAP